MQVPTAAREYVSEFLFLTQPVEELEHLAQETTLYFKPDRLAAAQTMWNRELDAFQRIVSLSFTLSGSVFSGILGQIRTKLVDVIADLTAATPLTELPRREDVDAAMLQRIGHIGDVYATTVVKPVGPTAIGAGAKASAGLSVDDVLALLAAVQDAAQTAGPDTSEIEDALAALKEAVTSPEAETGDVIKRAGRLREVADKLGVAAVSSATSAAITALTDLAMNGAFG
ncbi:hypothetical protein [Clavibacter zhangzhiyongii]|uniref:AbiTii domain-containing protein n=1 Tax=Clavibacter zhangzhiyongii TaxID=2768071 RepID=UPI0019562D78|nr:hypothetical protein [Clavibacter zhangzhiyongii]MBM7025313.1 hypothetical protein [Clavibacter zhangzhiyongii]